MSSATLKIKIFDAKGTHLVPMTKSTATVGSAKHCDVVLNHPTVQPEHARAWCEGGRIWVQDLGTPAGTTLNGIRLPPLKPMLVRELDIVKLGDCPATMGMEPNLVRAPVVMPKSNLPEFTATDIRPIVSPDASPEKKQEEYERMHRELADLKLQMQMARLEKSSDEDLRKELAAAKEEIARLKAEKEKLKESFNHFDGDKKTFKAQLENEVAELKLKSLRELKEQREEDTRKFEKWKSEAAANLASASRTLADQKAKTWNQRPFSKELAHEWDSEISAIFKRVILNNAPPPVQTASNLKVPIGLPPKEITQTNAQKAAHAPHPERRKRPRQSNDGPWQRIAVGGFILALFMAVAWYASIYLKRDGARTMASQMVETAPPPPPASRAAANPDAGKTSGFKKTYTDNVLGTINYVDAELNMDFRALWLKDLSRTAAKEWKLDAKAVNDIANKEIVLIQDLNRMKNNTAQMRQRESQFMKELQSRLGKRANTDKFMRLKRAFYTRNQVYLTRETR
jgi:hypothetical protein